MRPLATVVSASLALLAVAGAARADETPSLALEPAPAGERTLLTEPAQVRGDTHLRARAIADYSREPLVLLNDDQEYDRVVESQRWLHLLASFSLAHRVLFALDVPLVLGTTAGERAPHGLTTEGPESGSRLGDVRVGGRLKLLGPAGDGIHFGAAAAIWLPTGSDYAGDGGVRARGALVVDGVHDRFYWALDTGFRTRPGARLPGVLPTRVGTALTASAAAGIAFDSARRVFIATELSAWTTVSEGAKPLDARGSGVQLLEQVRVLPFSALELGAGIGPGIGQAPGAADFRVLAFAGWSPEQPPPPPDGDDDRIADRVDACPDLPGVAAGDPLLHGCPEAPRDFDGDEIPDQFDACPRDPGEPTGCRTTHGCPRESKP